MGIEIVPVNAVLGAEIKGVDLSQDLDDATFGRVKEAFYRYQVIFFRGRKLSDLDHVRFSARFGDVLRVKLSKAQPALPPEIGIVSNVIEGGEFIGKHDAGLFWHTDGAYAARPLAASFLRAIE